MTLVGIFLAAGLLYAAFVVLLAANEPRLLYFPLRGLASSPALVDLRFERVEIQTDDGVTLVGWVIPAPPSVPSPLWVLYLHGNAGNIGIEGLLDHYAALHRLGVTLLAIDYRGYGDSQGTPTEAGLYRDADACYAYLMSTRNVVPSRMVLYGHSLGAAVAIDLAHRRDIGGLIVEGGFTSVPDLGQELYPFLPVRLMARSRYASKEKVAAVGVPKLFLHAHFDEIVPIHHGRSLFQAAREPKTFVQIEGTHNDSHLVDGGKLYRAVGEFLDSVRRTE